MGIPPLTSERHQLDSVAEAIEFYFDHGWTDGLPVVPPTVDQVSRFLEDAGLQPAEILGTEPTKGRVVTAEKVAINAVMAGCKPGYFPVVVAAVEAVCQREFNLHAVSVSTMGSAVLVVVNGPVRGALGLNSGVGAFGPGHRSNATIGRAIRLVIANVTGAVPGEVDKGTLGHGGKFSWCVAEAEETSPWDPLHVERGSPPAESAVTVFGALSPIQFAYHDSTAPEDILDSAADALYASGGPHDELVVVLSPEHVGHLEAAGWTKLQVKEYLHQVGSSRGGNVSTGPDSYTVIVAGGAGGGFSAIVPLWGGGSNSVPVTRKIQTTS